ncbi:MAG: RraA family protein [Acidobacteriaceae bacterium]|nr:RraA family protein [Acidobacteriaceae bacterium]
MKKQIVLSVICAGILAAPSFAQLGMFTKDQRIAITREWKGERFEDGRPKVPDEVLNRLKNTTAEEAWDTLRKRGYHLQFEGDWKTVNVKPGDRLIGRAVTVQFVPLRPDLNTYINDKGKEENRIGRGQNSWVISTLVKGDVMVVDLYGKIKDGTIIGDNLGTSMMTKTGTGLVVNGAVRDPSGLSEIEGFKVFTRDFDPSFLADATLLGWNRPIRIGQATVLPGDVVLSDPDGVVFIPPQLAEEVADESELTELRDDWGHTMLREQKYNPGQIDGQWTPAMIDEFNRWAASKGSKLRMKTPNQ